MAPFARLPDPEELLAGRRLLGGRWTAGKIGWTLAAAALWALCVGELVGERWHSPVPVSVGVALLMCGSLAVVPRHPVASSLVALVVLGTDCLVWGTPQSLGVLFAFLLLSGGVARYADRRALPPLGVLLVVVTVVLALRDPTNGNRYDYLFTFGIWVAAAMAGLVVRARHAALLRAVERAVQLSVERAAAVEQAVDGERSRIARDLHDVVAHAISLMVVQAAAGRSVLGSDPRRAAGVMATIETTGQQALSELRRLLGVLRADEGSGLRTPGLDAVEELVGEADRAGLPCSLTWSGDRGALPDGVDVAAYRVVQEGVTNALKHGSRTALEVAVSRTEAGVRIVLLDRAGAPGRTALPAAGSGRGVRGMRERVAMYDGTFSAGPVDEGWRVEAFFPVASR